MPFELRRVTVGAGAPGERPVVALEQRVAANEQAAGSAAPAVPPLPLAGSLSLLRSRRLP
ncbi:MAG TPA: hypothetical protein VFH36_07080 [Acidimicrobiales bacterium]|nr:hypothetical protein [Acidimicrobiales bacterium]